MHKVWFGRLWCMTGRWQLMSLQRPLERPRIVERAWLRQIYAPYWYGSGVALTVGPWSIRFGTCRPGIEVDEPYEPDDEFYWDDFGPSFEEHLDASVFADAGDERLDVTFETVEPELVTAFVDTRTNRLTAVVHEGGEVEYIDGPLHHAS
jgi:hypothetical protein